MTAHPVLFLDIDGVLLPGRLITHDYQPGPVPWAHLLTGLAGLTATTCCPDMIAALNGVLDRTGARLVLISTWRRAVGGPETREILTMQGVADAWHDDFEAPWTGNKTGDIKAWLAAHREVDRWAAIDDDAIGRCDGMWNRCFQPGYHEGPQPAHWRQVEAALLRAD